MAAALRVAAALALTIHAARSGAVDRSKPNVVLLLVDDAGYGDLGITGHPSTRTPNIDALARRGRQLRTWYSAAAVCSASRTAILTGRQPPRVGMVGVLNSMSVGGLPLSEATLADDLRAAGYATLALGKWHQGQRKAYLPAARGFDEFLGLPYSVDDGTGYVSNCTSTVSADGGVRRVGLGPQIPLPLLDQANGSTIIVEQPTNLRLLTGRLVNRSVAFLERTKRPAFVYFAFGHVHTATPNIANRQYAACEFLNTTTRGPFGDALAEVDAAVGAVAAASDDNTLTIFVSDNGPALRWGLSAGSAGPFIGASAAYANGALYQNTAKGSTWEGGVRMPAFAVWPGVIAPGTISRTLVSSLDVLPSIWRLAGLGSLPRRVDGTESLADALLAGAEDAPTRHAFLPLYNNPTIANASTEIFAARMGSLKAHWITSPGLAQSVDGYTPTAPELIHDPPLVYDVDADPSEAFPLTDVAADVYERFVAHKKRYESELTPIAIDPTFGYEYALCCGYGCDPDNCTCECANVPI